MGREAICCPSPETNEEIREIFLGHGPASYGFGAKGMRPSQKTVVFAIWQLLRETPSSGQMPCGPCQSMCVPRVASDVCSRKGRILERLLSPGWPPALLMLTLPGAASGTLGEPCQPRFLGSGHTPERVCFFPFHAVAFGLMLPLTQFWVEKWKRSLVK